MLGCFNCFTSDSGPLHLGQNTQISPDTRGRCCPKASRLWEMKHQLRRAPHMMGGGACRAAWSCTQHWLWHLPQVQSLRPGTWRWVGEAEQRHVPLVIGFAAGLGLLIHPSSLYRGCWSVIMVSKDENPVSHFSRDEVSRRAGPTERTAPLLEEMIS